MKKKFLLLFLLAVVIVITIFLGVKDFREEKINQITEYIPQEEISEEQQRQTLVTLYFQDAQTKDVMPEARLIDSKQLIENPYRTLINLLLEGPKNDKLQAIIPEGTKIKSITKEGNTAVVNFNSEFTNGIRLGKEQEEKIVYTIVNTLTELTEIDSVKILVEGQEGAGFDDNAVEFKDAFYRIN